MGVFEQKVAVVVGGGRGIGRATALALAREGARVVIQDSGAQPDGSSGDGGVAESVAEAIRSNGGQALALATSATDASAPEALIEAAVGHFGRIDAGFYSAAVVRERPLLRMSDEDFDLVWDVHARAAFRFARQLGRAMIEQKQGGSILLCSSTAGFAGTPGQSALAAAALAVAGLTRTAASELRRQGIRVNALVPTARTRLTEELPLFRSIRPDSLSAEHAAEVACFLLSEGAQEVSGEIIGVAGGRCYAFRSVETPGIFVEGPPVPLAALASRMREVLGS